MVNGNEFEDVEGTIEGTDENSVLDYDNGFVEGQGEEPSLDKNEDIEADAESSEDESEETDKNAAPDDDQEDNQISISRVELNKLRREHFRHVNKIDELNRQLAEEKARAAELNYLNDLSYQTAMSHYEAAAKEKLERARDMRELAIESGDTKAMSETEIALTKAVFEYEKLKNEQASQNVRTESQRALDEVRNQAQNMYQPQQYAQRPSLSEENMHFANDWVQRNPWFKTTSPNYDYEKHMLANQACDQLDAYCNQNGMAHMIGSQDYFDELDRYMSQTNQPTRGQQMSTKQQQPRNTSRQVVAPARGRSYGTSQGSTGLKVKDVPLSSVERELVKRLGVSEDEYKKNKLLTAKDDYFKDQLKQHGY